MRVCVLACMRGRGRGGQIQILPLSCAPHMPTFNIPTIPTISQISLAYNAPKEEARRTKRCNTMPRRGTMMYDREKGGMTLEWAIEGEFLAWLAAEESEKTIELVVSKIERSDSPNWREKCVLCCSREFTGGKLFYQKRHQWDRKIPSKKTGCPCCLMTKQYHGTDFILGKYEDMHNHTLGNDNLQFTRLSVKTRNIVIDMVHTGIESKAIVSHFGVINLLS